MSRHVLQTGVFLLLAAYGLAPELTELADCLTARGPVPARGVALVSQLLADGGGPLYRAGGRQDLGDLIGQAAQAFTR